MENILQTITSCTDKLKSIREMVPLGQYLSRVKELDTLTTDPDIWKDPKHAAALMKERQKLSELINKFNGLHEQAQFYLEYVEAYPQDMESCSSQVEVLYAEIDEFEFQQMMTDPLANSPAILTINAGSGGLEAANWVTMLLRMYLRWSNSYKFNMEYLDMKPSEEHSAICTDAVSIRIEGPYAYGFLKGENGVHRLIRNSPFNAGDARHTSFAAVSVLPDIEDDINIEINDKDIEITAQTSSGSGGQNINKVASAIRLKHFPTGINILVRTERDQLANKKIALKMLKSKLYDMELKKRQREKDKLIESQMQNKFGSQIRTYYLNPYSLTKDHRTGYEINNTEDVLDGNIQEFILSFLKK